MNGQEVAAFSIVGLAAAAVLRSFYKSVLAEPLSKALLKRGSIKLALKVRAQAKTSGCDNCGTDKPCCH